MKNTGNARIARNENSTPRPKRKNSRKDKGQGGAEKLKNFLRKLKNRENAVF